MGGGKSKPAAEPVAAPPPVKTPAKKVDPAAAVPVETTEVKAMYKISAPPNFQPAAPKPLAPGKPVLGDVRGKNAYSVEQLLKMAHDGHDLGNKANILFDKFDADKNGIIDNDEMANLIKAMLETTMQTLIEASKGHVELSIKQRPKDEETIRQEAQDELDMLVPYAKAQIARAKDIAVEMRAAMDDDNSGTINKEEFIGQVTNCLKSYADFNVC